MRSRYLYFFFLVFFIPFFSQAAPVSGPIKPEAILHFYPELNAVGTAYRVPVVVNGVSGVAEIGKAATTGRMLSKAVIGRLGFWGMAAVSAVQLCYEETDWKICHAQIDPIVPIDVDTSRIFAATQTQQTEAAVPHGQCMYQSNHNFGYMDKDVCLQQLLDGVEQYVLNPPAYTVISKSLSSESGSMPIYIPVSVVYKYGGYQYGPSNVINGLFYPDGAYSCPTGYTLQGSNCVATIYSCSMGSVLSNSSGAPSAMTGQYCTPEGAYSCPENYFRSDAYGNLGSDGMFCSYQAPTVSEQYRNDVLAPVLLNYYANQLFTDNEGKLDPDYFADTDTTFDPTVTPSDMPMTWEQLKNYVDWVRTGVAQTTDPLAPHYISPTNYDYTNNYITNNDSVTNNTSSATSTNITPQQASSSAAMTQTQYEASNKKADTEQATAFTSAFTGVTTALDQLSTDKQEIIDKIGSPAAPPSEMPDIFNWTWPAGSCQGFDLDLNLYIPIVGTLNLKKTVNEHCPPYNEYFHPTFFWFFNMITLLYVFRLWDKTAADVAKI